jgi:hypothetical protein
LTMNVITICYIDDLCEIVNYPICLSGTITDELEVNMWCIALDGGCLQHFTSEAFLRFFDTLIVAREHQIGLLDPHKQATFYVWFDQQALQLRLNMLSDTGIDLPFGCRVQRILSLRSIIDNFIDTVSRVNQYGDHIEMIEPTDPDFDNDDDDDTQNFTLDVWVVTLKPDSSKLEVK